MPTIEELQAQLDETKAKVKSLSSTPDFSHVYKDADGRTVGTWEELDEDPITLVHGRDDLRGSSRDEMVSMMPFDRSVRKSDLQRTIRKSMMRNITKQGYQPRGTFKSMNQWVREGLDSHHTREFKDKSRAHFKSIQGMSEGVGSDGGFTVMPEYSTKIFERVYSNDLIAKTDAYSVAGNNMTFLANAETSRIDGNRHGGLRGYWTSEGNTITSSKPTLREVQLKLQKVAVVVYLTDELINDNGAALEQYVTRKASDEFNFLIGAGLFRGDSVGKPMGIINAPSFLAISAETGQSQKTIITENIANIEKRFFAPFLPNAEWYYNQDVLGQLRLLTLGIGSAGVATYMPPGGMSGAPYSTISGRPANAIEFASTLGSVGDIVLADFSQVLSISKGGISQAVSMHVEFLTDQLALRFTMRMNAQPWENSAITPYQGSNTQSSFIGLAAR